jgi:hypothetical protein
LSADNGVKDTQSPIQISPVHDVARLRDEFGQRSRVQIRDFLTIPSADAIFRCLSEQKDWNLVYIAGGKHVDSDAGVVARWPLAQRRQLKKVIHAEARGGFQYCFANLPIYDIYHGRQLPGHLVNDIFLFLNSRQFLDMMRDITADKTIEFADAQATRFDPGHFLACHDDEVDGKNRRVAYVLSLSPVWCPDWGGALQFFGANGNIEEAYVPAYNTLNLFRVPTDHSVGIVAPFAAASRYSVTGWLRSGKDPRA